MNMPEFFSVASCNGIVTCPNCGGDHYESNHIDEALYREAAREVPFLVFEGRQKEAEEVLTALSVVRIFNLTRPAHFCLSCGASFGA